LSNAFDKWLGPLARRRRRQPFRAWTALRGAPVRSVLAHLL